MKTLLVFAALLVCVYCGRYTSFEDLHWRTDYKDEAPPNGTTDVQVGAYLNQLRIGNDGIMRTSMYFRQKWQDERLAGIYDNGRVSSVAVWTPDLFFRDSLRAETRRNDLTYETLTTINSTGHIFYVRTLEVDFICNDLLRDTGSDDITCPMRIESYGFTTETLTISPLEGGAISFDRNIFIPNFTVRDINTKDCSETYSIGTFPCLNIELSLRRD